MGMASADEARMRLLLRERKRRGARGGLLEFVCATYTGYEVGVHHIEIADRLEALERGEIKRLLITEPPRHGKTLLASQRFPAWFIGRNPRAQIVHAAYGGELAKEYGRSLRNLMDTDEYRWIFPDCRLASDSRATNKWHTQAGGVYIAAGVGGPITGRGADLLLIDDPIKSFEEADSDAQRERLWKWFMWEAHSRLMPGVGRVVIIQTRWHEDDLMGRLLKEQAEGTGEAYELLHHPAINDAGEPLWPQRFTREELEMKRTTYGPRTWQAMWMGQPTPDSGDYFKQNWIRHKRLGDLESMNFYGASDYAVSAKGDYTVHIVIGVDEHDDMWVVDLWRGKTSPDKWIPPLLEMMKKYRPVCWAEEQGQIEKSIGPFLKAEQIKAKAWCRREAFSTSRDKAARAKSIQARMSLRGLYLPAGAPWAGPLEGELLTFPAGTYDDQVDALSLIGRMLAGIEPGRRVAPEPSEEPNSEITMNQLIELEDRRLGGGLW